MYGQVISFGAFGRYKKAAYRLRLRMVPDELRYEIDVVISDEFGTSEGGEFLLNEAVHRLTNQRSFNCLSAELNV